MSNNSSKGTLGILDLLLVIFIVLKLTGVIIWPWVIVLIPLWITLGCVAIILIIWLLQQLF